jgi:hypothetical protein
VFGLIDRHSITHALEALNYRSQQQRSHLVSQFVTTAANGQLIRARIAPVLGGQREMSGFILTKYYPPANQIAYLRLLLPTTHPPVRSMPIIQEPA